MGFKEYAIHIAVRHHFLESLMAEIKTPEMADMLEEVIAARHAKEEQVVTSVYKYSVHIVLYFVPIELLAGG